MPFAIFRPGMLGSIAINVALLALWSTQGRELDAGYREPTLMSLSQTANCEIFDAPKPGEILNEQNQKIACCNFTKAAILSPPQEDTSKAW